MIKKALARSACGGLSFDLENKNLNFGNRILNVENNIQNFEDKIQTFENNVCMTKPLDLLICRRARAHTHTHTHAHTHTHTCTHTHTHLPKPLDDLICRHQSLVLGVGFPIRDLYI